MIKLGFIGCGFVAQQCHLPCFSSIDKFSIEAVADPVADLREKIAQKYYIPKEYNSHDELLRDEKIDAVIVTLPRRHTANVVLDCLKAKKHVFSEKPLCLNSETGRNILETAKKAGKGVHVGYMKRYDDATTHLISELKNKYQQDQKPKIIRAYCYMGDSYATPFGDFKGSVDRLFCSEEENLPSDIPQAHHPAYEQFINVFSHMTDLLEYTTGSHIDINAAQIDEWGTGVLIGQLGNIPLSLEFVRGTQKRWLEGIDFVFENSVLKVEYPAAFKRNTSGKVIHINGDDGEFETVIKPSSKWAFFNQANYFADFVKQDNEDQLEMIEDAIRQVQMSQEIFLKYIV